MDDLILGDVTVRDSADDGGFSISVSNKPVVHIYASGELQLFKWLAEKYGQTISPPIISVEQADREWKEQHNPPPEEKENE